jgi:hypothetical protein
VLTDCVVGPGVGPSGCGPFGGGAHGVNLGTSLLKYEYNVYKID